MPRYVTSLHRNARVTHLGYPITACGVTFVGPHHASDVPPAGRPVCRACIRKAADFGWLTPADADRLLALTADDSAGLDDQIVGLLIDGRADREIAHRLRVSERTVSRHIAQAMNDASATSRFQWGYRLGTTNHDQRR